MYWSVHRSTQSYIHDLARESRSNARSLSAAFDDDIRVNEWDQVDDVLQRIRPDGTEAAVFTNDGKLWHALPGFPDSLKLATGVAKAPGYETPPTTYIVANGTNIYSDHALYETKVMGELKRGDRVEVLAKVKGWEWVLIGKDGIGIGYVSISMLSPADKYVP